MSSLLSAGAGLHITDNCGLTPLMVAVHGAEMMEGEHTAENIVRSARNTIYKYQILRFDLKKIILFSKVVGKR